MDYIGIGVAAAAFIGFLCILFGSFFTVTTMHAAIVERFGKFLRVAQPGLNFKTPFIDSVVYIEDLSMQLMDVDVSSKTKDDATVTIPVRVQYYVLPDKVKEAYYQLDDPEHQIEAHVENVILSYIPKLDLDETYLQEDLIAAKIKANLTDVMARFGYAIENALVTKIIPADAVIEAMNDINAARREQVATEARAAANKMLKIADAEAESRAKVLQGEGIAGQRKAIIDGLEASVSGFKKATGVDTQEVMALVMLTQYFDALRDIGAHSNTILLPNSPSAVGAFLDEFRKTMLVANLASETPEK